MKLPYDTFANTVIYLEKSSVMFEHIQSLFDQLELNLPDRWFLGDDIKPVFTLGVDYKVYYLYNEKKALAEETLRVKDLTQEFLDKFEGGIYDKEDKLVYHSKQRKLLKNKSTKPYLAYVFVENIVKDFISITRPWLKHFDTIKEIDNLSKTRYAYNTIEAEIETLLKECGTELGEDEFSHLLAALHRILEPFLDKLLTLCIKHKWSTLSVEWCYQAFFLFDHGDWRIFDWVDKFNEGVIGFE